MKIVEGEQELITVGITSYNAADTIERAVNSALGQTWGTLEIVIVDDASSDGTARVLKGIANKHNNVRVYVNEKNSGVAASRNQILKEAKGTFVVFFDDDDLSLPNRITEQYKRISDYEQNFANGKPVVCHTARLQIYPDGAKRCIKTMGEMEGRVAPNGIAVADRILRGKPLKDGYGACPTCSQMARLSVYQKLDGFDNNLRRGEDTDFNIRLAVAGGHFVGISAPLVSQTMTKTVDKHIDEELRNSLILLEKHKAIIDKNGDYDFCYSWIEAKYAFLKYQFISFTFLLCKLFFIHPIWTLERIVMAVPNINLNRAFSRFYLKSQNNQHVSDKKY